MTQLVLQRQILCQLDTQLAEWAFTLAASEGSAGTSASLAVAYALNDTVSVTGKTDQVAGAESVQTITATTTLNGVSVACIICK